MSWVARHYLFKSEIVEDGSLVAVVYDRKSAVLIAATPDVLKALETLVTALDWEVPPDADGP